jgi:hypothetical protein
MGVTIQFESHWVELAGIYEMKYDAAVLEFFDHLAARLGYANEGYLQMKFPDLCRAIRQKIAARKTARLAEMERVLTEALKEEPVPTLNDLRSRLGYSSSECLRLHFPGLCEQILARRRTAREQRTAELRIALQDLLLEVPLSRFVSSAHALVSPLPT